MRRFLKWLGIVVGGLVGLALLAVVVLYTLSGIRLNRTYSIQPEATGIPTDQAAIERGRHWTAIRCAGCHGENLAGTVIFEDPSLGRVEAHNLTAGRGGVGGQYEDADWVQAIRHGVGPDGKPIMIMPAASLYFLSDADLGDIIAYLKSVPPVDSEMGGHDIKPLARVLAGAGVFGEFVEAELIDHNAPRPAAPQPGVSVAYGDYLLKTSGCGTCHGADLSGGQPPEPGSPRAPNITPGGPVGAWSEATFISVTRTRESRYMPYKVYARMTDDELKALWLYLRSLPAKSGAGR